MIYYNSDTNAPAFLLEIAIFSPISAYHAVKCSVTDTFPINKKRTGGQPVLIICYVISNVLISTSDLTPNR